MRMRSLFLVAVFLLVAVSPLHADTGARTAEPPKNWKPLWSFNTQG